MEVLISFSGNMNEFSLLVILSTHEDKIIMCTSFCAYIGWTLGSMIARLVSLAGLLRVR